MKKKSPRKTKVSSLVAYQSKGIDFYFKLAYKKMGVVLYFGLRVSLLKW